MAHIILQKYAKMKPMKIALVLDDRLDRPGGVQEYVLGLYQCLRQRNQEVKILTSGRYSSFFRKKYPVVGFGGYSWEIKSYGGQTSIHFLLGAKKVAKFLDQEKFDLFHLQGPFGLLGRLVLENSQGVNIVTFHVTHSPFYNLLSRSFRPYFSLFKKKIHGLLAISSVAEEFAQKIFPGKYQIIPPGVDLSLFHPQAAKIKKFQDEKINLLFLGRLDKRKGVAYLLRALSLLPSRNWRLLLVGEGLEKKSLQRLVKEKSLKNVHFFGFVPREKLPSYYATADIFCSPATHGETFGVVLLEAMASGLPLVAFDNPGYRQVFPNFQKPFLVPNKNIGALSQALAILISYPRLRQELSQKNRKEVQKYSWEKVGSEILKFYQKSLQFKP